MDDIKREQLEKAQKTKKDHRVRIRTVAVRMVRVLDMSVDGTASLQVPLFHVDPRPAVPLRRRRFTGSSNADGPDGFCKIP